MSLALTPSERRDQFGQPLDEVTQRGLEIYEGQLKAMLEPTHDGDRAVPPDVARRLDALPLGRRGLSLADGSLFVSGAVEIELDWQGETRQTEVLILDGTPLLGAVLMEGFHLGADMEPGGDVSLEPL